MVGHFQLTSSLETKTVEDHVYTIYRTPVGEVSSERRTELTFQFPGQGSWTVEHPVKNLQDLKVVKFMVEDTVYEPQYEIFRQSEEELESDGVVTAGTDYTPLMKTIVGYMGFRTFAILSLMKSIDGKNIESLSPT